MFHDGTDFLLSSSVFPVCRIVPQLLSRFSLNERINPDGDYSRVLLQESGTQEADWG